MILTVYARPGAKSNKIDWLDDETLKVSVVEPPEKGRANKAIIELLSKEFNISKSKISITRGLNTKIKTISITE